MSAAFDFDTDHEFLLDRLRAYTIGSSPTLFQTVWPALPQDLGFATPTQNFNKRPILSQELVKLRIANLADRPTVAILLDG